jgi:uncharacterized protein (TIGR02301 family)
MLKLIYVLALSAVVMSSSCCVPAYAQALAPDAHAAPDQKGARRKAAPTQAPVTEPSKSEMNDAPYEGPLLRLSEILGTLSYLRDLCGGKDGHNFRAQMGDLLAAESANEARRDRLAGAFNKGFMNFETVYRTCTPNAQSLMNSYIDEGGTLARDISSRFGG